MPVIDVTYPAGALNARAQEAVAAHLTDILMDIEGSKGIAAIAAGTWLLPHEAAPNMPSAEKSAQAVIGSKSQPAGTLNMAQKEALIQRVTDALLRIDGVEPDAAQRARIYCLINEVPDGGWGFAGLAITREYAAKRRKELEQGQA